MGANSVSSRLLGAAAAARSPTRPHLEGERCGRGLRPSPRAWVPLGPPFSARAGGRSRELLLRPTPTESGTQGGGSVCLLLRDAEGRDAPVTWLRLGDVGGVAQEWEPPGI